MADTPVTALEIITSAFETIGVYAQGEDLRPADADGALGRLNRYLSSARLQPLMQPVVRREVFDLTADKGGPDDPYTIGPGADFDTTKPVTLTGAGIILVQDSPAQNIEVPRSVLTDDGWQAIQIKDLPSPLFTDVYFNPTWSTSGWGTINLWPVPNTSVNQLVLYRAEFLSAFATLTTQYYLPPGAAETLEYQLARRLLTPYGITDAATVADVRDMARATLQNFMRANVKLSDRTTDPALTHDRRGYYNILTGSGGGAGA